MRSVIVGLCLSLLVAGVAPGCATHKPPASLSPQGKIEFKATQAIHALDQLMDIAIIAEASTPKFLSTANTRRVVNYHQSAVKTIRDVPSGWKATVDTGLTELLANLSEQERLIVAPYVTLFRTILQEVQ